MHGAAGGGVTDRGLGPGGAGRADAGDGPDGTGLSTLQRGLGRGCLDGAVRPGPPHRGLCRG